MAARFFDIDDLVISRNGKQGKIVTIPADYSFASVNDPFTMARLVYVQFDHEEPILIPESRIEHIRS